MEHIERALARAREMRSSRVGEAQAASGGAAARPSVDGVAPDYTETVVQPHDQRRISEQRLVAYDFNNPAADVYRLLRAQVLQRMKKLHVSTLAITSATAGEGTTTTATNLAISIALDVNQTVLLVDLNLRDPSIQRRFGINPTAGIDDYLAGQCTLKDCLVNPGLARLVILPARTAKGDAAEAMSSPRMASLVKELRGRYADRIIIFDTPPLLDSGETIGFLPNVDATLFVARSGKTTKQELDRAAGLLQNYRVIGTLLNAH